MHTLPLFPDTDADAQLRCLLAQFDQWVAYRAENPHGSRAREQRALRDESVAVYRDMWRSFAEYCAPRGLSLATMTVADLEMFLTVRGIGEASGAPRITTRGDALSSRYARRYLELIERITRWLALQAQTLANPAASDLLQRPDYKYANANDKDPAPQYLAAAQARRLIAHVTELRAGTGTDGSMTWKEVRDRTAVAVMLGAGLAPGDVRALRLAGVKTKGGRIAHLPWKLALPGNGNIDPRETPLARWAARQLAFWLTVRAQTGIAGDAVFPATASGRDWSHTRCFESCRAVLATAGLASDAHGLFQLRHTFALRQLSRGKSEADVACWLGLKNLAHMARYSRILVGPVEVV